MVPALTRDANVGYDAPILNMENVEGSEHGDTLIGGTAMVAATYRHDAGTDRAILTPAKPLARDKTYQVVMNRYVLDPTRRARVPESPKVWPLGCGHLGVATRSTDVNTVYGGFGADDIATYGGNATAYGGYGVDKIAAHDGDDTMNVKPEYDPYLRPLALDVLLHPNLPLGVLPWHPPTLRRVPLLEPSRLNTCLKTFLSRPRET